ncbi:VOC family protein [Aquiflexum lacus]|uniref:VOC family protein n=1 Tax=Aquiflexum lacus TaxID=2483805 RepID=UPI001E3B6690|nr:VOC family protein [Aquiflexum lacus]
MKHVKIEHIAIWTVDLEAMRSFYQTYFGFDCNQKYVNEKKGFSSYFLSFPDGCRLELMHSEKLNVERQHHDRFTGGYAHIAFSLGSREAVDNMTEKLISDGFEKLEGPRMTGDGYYESVFFDPERNIIELTI